MAGLLRGPHHLANEGLRTLGALVAVADAAGPDMEIVVARRHGCTCLGKSRRWGTAASLGVRGPARYFRVCCLTKGGRVVWILRLVHAVANPDPLGVLKRPTACLSSSSGMASPSWR